MQGNRKKCRGGVRPRTGHEDPEGYRGIALLFFLTLALDGVGGQHHALAALPLGKRPGTHCIGGWVATGPVWRGAENLAPTGIRSPDRSARSKSLYRLRYPGPHSVIV